MAGEDYEAFKQCSSLTKRRQLFIGLVICLVFLISFLGITEAFTEFFHSTVVGLTLGVFFGWTLVNIYLLLLYTLARNTLVPSHIKATSRLAVVLRLGTIIFFAIIVSKPIEHFLFQKYTFTEITIERSKHLEDLSAHITNSYNRRISQLTNEIQQEKLIRERERELQNIKDIVKSNNYYLESLKRLSNKGWPWFLTLVIIMLFVWPIYLKRAIKPDTLYYQIRRQNELSVVLTEYERFKSEYVTIINSFTSKDEHLQYSEPYIDPPFNFQLRSQNFNFSKQSQFLEEIHGG